MSKNTGISLKHCDEFLVYMPNNGPARVNWERMETDIPKVDFVPFAEEIKKLENLCERLDKFDAELEEAIKNYIIFRLVSLLDVHIKMIVSDLIDRFNVSPSQALGESSINIELDSLERVRSEEFTIGKVVVTNLKGYTTRIDTLSKIFLNINGLDFFPWIEELSNEKYQEKLDSLFEQRNDLTHQAHAKMINDSKPELRDKIKTADSFIRLAYMFSSYNLTADIEKRNEQMKNDFSGALTPKKFTETTDAAKEKMNNKKKKQDDVYCSDCGNLVENPKFKPKPGNSYYCPACFPKHRK